MKADEVYSVSEITRFIKLQLETSFPLIWVEGEISNFHRHHSGHLYFTLKDESSQLKGVMWRSLAEKIRFDLKDGLQVVCRGSINVYEPRGEYQLMVQLVEPKGKGALQLAFEQLRDKLKKEGLFDTQHKKKLPLFPKKVGIVTSPRGAAIVDILQTLERRFARLHILIYPVRVQGEGAADEIVEGIDFLSRIPDLDVIIIGRGGGSIEDLWAFNEESVARAVFDCPVPVISAVGHEIDFTISDFVADIRASTPSIAAEMLIEKEQAFEERILNSEKRIIQQTKLSLQQQSNKVFRLIHHRAFQNFKIRLLNQEQRVDELETRVWNFLSSRHAEIKQHGSRLDLLSEKLRNGMVGLLEKWNSRWEKTVTQLHNLSPLNILKKGYTLCWKNGGRSFIRDIEEIDVNDDIIVTFYKGNFSCTVKEVDRKKLIESYIKES
ncbi:MAG: exodeoxyribonuclease VII large subunit [Candidatus Aminicenantes bacterium]|nr:exodeoxyribonuclease VII large subunit [Candidatus Aminicenantes bacterium]